MQIKLNIRQKVTLQIWAQKNKFIWGTDASHSDYWSANSPDTEQVWWHCCVLGFYHDISNMCSSSRLFFNRSEEARLMIFNNYINEISVIMMTEKKVKIFAIIYSRILEICHLSRTLSYYCFILMLQIIHAEKFKNLVSSKNESTNMTQVISAKKKKWNSNLWYGFSSSE